MSANRGEAGIRLQGRDGRRCQAQTRINVDVLLVTHSDLADDIEIRPIGLES